MALIALHYKGIYAFKKDGSLWEFRKIDVEHVYGLLWRPTDSMVSKTMAQYGNGVLFKRKAYSKSPTRTPSKR
ncbi:MAG: hypothetical protein U9N49_03225 [Campylobacterota bacterium]|nr:hypothetical protein [Campylobacterota bacterium]